MEKKKKKFSNKKNNQLLITIYTELINIKSDLKQQQTHSFEKTEESNSKPKKLNIFGLADYLKESPQSIYLKVKRNELPYTRCKKQPTFDVAEIDLLLGLKQQPIITNC